MKDKGILTNVYLILFLYCVAPVANAQIRNKVCDTIHYEFIKDKIIIPVTVNNVKTKYLVDTGGRTGTMRNAAAEMKAVSAGYKQIADINTQSNSFQEAYIQDITIGKQYKLNQLKTLVFPHNPFLEELGVAGILGGDAFAQSVITFDSRSKIMVINYPYRPERLKVNDGTPLTDDNNYSKFKIRIGSAEKNILFDTGAHGFLLYSNNDLEKLQTVSGSKTVNHGHGIIAAGIAGLGTPVDIKKVVVPSIHILGKDFTNVGSVTTVMSETIIGVDLLKYGKVIIDYMRKLIYFFPYNEEATDMKGAVPLWNVNVLPRNKRFEVTTVWDSIKDKVNIGDEVVNINGTSLEGCPMTQEAVEKIMDAIPGETGYIIVRKENKEKRIEIKKEK